MEFNDHTLRPKFYGIEEQQPSIAIPEDIKLHNVSMNHANRINISASDNNTYYLGTVGRSGCDAVLVWRTDPKGNDEILLTHYPPHRA